MCDKEIGKKYTKVLTVTTSRWVKFPNMHCSNTFVVRKHNLLLFLQRESSKVGIPGYLTAYILKVIKTLSVKNWYWIDWPNDLMWYIKIEFNGQNTALLLTCLLNQLTDRLAAVSYFARKKLASHLPSGAIHYYSWPICCIWWWPSRAISIYHTSKAIMQLSQFRPKVSQFNETNKDFSFKCQWHHVKQNWLTDWRSQLSTDLQSILSTPNLQPFGLKYSLFSATLSHQSQ